MKRYFHIIVPTLAGKSSPGFSLLSVVVAAGIFSIVALGMSRFMTGQTQIMEAQQNISSIDLVALEMRSALGVSNFCTQNFAGKIARGSINASRLLNHKGEVVFRKNQKLKNKPISLSDMTLTNFQELSPDSGKAEFVFRVTRSGKTVLSKSTKRAVTIFYKQDSATKRILSCSSGDLGLAIKSVVRECDAILLTDFGSTGTYGCEAKCEAGETLTGTGSFWANVSTSFGRAITPLPGDKTRCMINIRKDASSCSGGHPYSSGCSSKCYAHCTSIGH